MGMSDADRADRLARALDAALDDEGLEAAAHALEQDDPDLADLLHAAARVERDLPGLLVAGEEGLPEPPTVFLRDLRERLTAEMEGTRVRRGARQRSRWDWLGRSGRRGVLATVAAVVALAIAVAGSALGIGRLTPVAVRGPAVTAVPTFSAAAGLATTRGQASVPITASTHASRNAAALRPVAPPSLARPRGSGKSPTFAPRSGVTATAPLPGVTSTLQGTAVAPSPHSAAGQAGATAPGAEHPATTTVTPMTLFAAPMSGQSQEACPTTAPPRTPIPRTATVTPPMAPPTPEARPSPTATPRPGMAKGPGPPPLPTCAPP